MKLEALLSETSRGKRTVAYLPGGGISGALYQLGALAALEEEGFHSRDLDGWVAVGSGAVVAAALAGGLEVQRLYRGLLDPADTLFPLERRHLLSIDVGEWRRAAGAVFTAVRRALANAREKPVETAVDPWQEIDRFWDTLPAGLFSLEELEHFLDAFFERRSVPLTFRGMKKRLLVPAHDLDTGEMVPFGSRGLEDAHIARAICASMALPLFFAPVRIGDRQLFAGSAGNASAIELAVTELGAEVIVVINPLVPVSSSGGGVRAKGLLWVANQAMRIGEDARLRAEIPLLRARNPGVEIVVIEPSPAFAVRFMDSPMSYSSRRTILENAFRSVREQIRLG